MIERLDAVTLRSWLETGRPVLVIDVRGIADREQWSIPGSIHVDAYEALKAGHPTVLSQMRFAPDVPVVTVCGVGKVSELAAEELTSRAVRAYSLVGGMKAWSLAWNLAELSLPGLQIVQVRRTGKGCLSYVVCTGTEAIVVDAALPTDVYLKIAKDRGARIRFVTDTHIHADHLSRSRLLADEAGAELLLPPQGRVRFPFRPWQDGETISFGSARLVSICSPGHTLESSCYLLEGHALFSGDTLFAHSVGRPDLHAAGGTANMQAHRLYQSVSRLLRLPPDTVLCPGHASTPTAFDGVFLSERLGNVAQRLQPWMVSETSFTERVLARIPPTPANYEQIVEWNEAGILPPVDPTDLEAGANRCAVG